MGPVPEDPEAVGRSRAAPGLCPFRTIVSRHQGLCVPRIAGVAERAGYAAPGLSGPDYRLEMPLRLSTEPAVMRLEFGGDNGEESRGGRAEPHFEDNPFRCPASHFTGGQVCVVR